MTKRTTLALHEEDMKRMHRACEITGVSQAKLISCLLAMSEDEMTSVIARNLPKISEERKQRRASRSEERRETANIIKQLSPEQIKAILAAAVAGSQS